jgi:protein phosphatase
VVYVHCKIGYSRSAAVIGAWIIDAQLASTSRYAIGMLRAVRPSVIVRCEVVAALQAFHNQGPSVDTPPPSFAEVRA